jgi:uncharacterized protein (DUF433 family)
MRGLTSGVVKGRIERDDLGECSMTLSVPDVDTLPLEMDANGVIHIANTRVPLDTVISVFEAGASAEEIAHRYPVLALADVYSVIGYYLRHQEEVETYLQERSAQRAQFKRESQARYDHANLRARLLARKQA